MKRIAILIAVVAMIAAACGSGDATDTTVPATLTTTSSTAAPDTTTTAPPETTTTAVETTTTTVPETTTTTTTIDMTVELTGEGIQAGPTWVHFGFDDDDAIAAFEAVFGPATDDTGWLDSLTDGWEQFGVCPGPNVRGVRWGTATETSLQVLFTDSESDFWTEGVEHFFAYYYYDGSNPTGLMTPEGIGVDSSVGQLKAAYEGPDFTFEEAFFDPSQGFWQYKPAPWTGLWGYTTGIPDAFKVISVNGGRGCGE